jgi:hypothetical protein
MKPKIDVTYSAPSLPPTVISVLATKLIYSTEHNILWHTDPLLGNDGEICSYTTAVAK